MAVVDDIAVEGGVGAGCGGGEGVPLTFRFDKWPLGWQSSGRQAIILLVDESGVDELCCDVDESGACKK